MRTLIRRWLGIDIIANRLQAAENALDLVHDRAARDAYEKRMAVPLPGFEADWAADVDWDRVAGGKHGVYGA